MEYKEIIWSVNDRVGTITLNRPARLNAWTDLMATEVRNALNAASEDNGVRAVIITGAGRGFCAGQDMGVLDASADLGAPADGADLRRTFAYLPGITKPLIAAINGPAAGVGLILSLYCDLRFASEKAVFSTAFSRRGLVAEHGVSWLLPRIVGLPNALDLLFSARKVDAAEALRMGLVNRLFPEGELMGEANAYATELAASVSPRSLRVIRKQIYAALSQTLIEAIDAADEEVPPSIQSEDFREGVKHFIEKRAPSFTGR